MTIPSIEQVIAAIPDWAGRVVTAERIPAGLTNTNWRVVVDGTPFFVRIPGADTELLAVDRGNEIHNTIAAAEAGVAPRVVTTVPRVGRLRARVARCADDVERGAAGGRDAGADRGDAPAAPCRSALPRRLRHVPRRRALPGARRRAVDRNPRRLSRAPRACIPRIEAALGGPSAADRPLPQRPPRRELPRRRRASVAGRLGVQRQQRPGVRARQHRPGARLRRLARSRSCAPPTSAKPPLPCSPGCASR